jgi:hypothetical protein
MMAAKMEATTIPKRNEGQDLLRQEGIEVLRVLRRKHRDLGEVDPPHEPDEDRPAPHEYVGGRPGPGGEPQLPGVPMDM